jgi:hypothetical protein
MMGESGSFSQLEHIRKQTELEQARVQGHQNPC